MKTRLIHTNVQYNFLYYVLKEATQILPKFQLHKTFLSSVYFISANYFDESFLFHVRTGIHYIFIKVCH